MNGISLEHYNIVKQAIAIDWFLKVKYYIISCIKLVPVTIYFTSSDDFHVPTFYSVILYFKYHHLL